MTSAFNQIYPGQAVAICNREQAARLVEYDHHIVYIGGRPGVMLTYEWMPVAEHAGPFVLTVVFHHAEGHPPAPESVQHIVDGLTFRARSQPR